MNNCIEILNRWGECFSALAWPMLWQSSLLIAVIFAFDLMFARRIRAPVRYALWMVVLVKLLLPPALALPTGATWWLWRPHLAVEPAPAIQNYSVSFSDGPPETSPPVTVPVVEPPPKLSGDAWVLLAAAAMGAGLLSWLAFRWLSVAATVRRGAVAPAELDLILEEARQLAGLRQPLRLKLIDDRHSPAVYGLFRPVILLPQTLANQLSGRQLRAVLLHEAIHLRRGDVWVNFAQTLLQIAYWWHPLLWAANSRIRRVREEAVDDAVMFALRDGADAYAPTLLEVAKFAFRRPRASLGLIGILESRSALRQRVERLLDFQPPRRTGLTVLSLFGIFAFSAVALPMGQGPEEASSTRSSGPETSSSVITNGVPAAITVTRETGSSGHTNVVFDGRRDEIYRKMNQIHLDTVSYPDVPLSEVLGELRKSSLKLDPDKQGINFLFNPNISSTPGLPIKADAASPAQININLKLNNVSLQDDLNAIVLVADHPIKYSVEDYGIVFSVKGTNSPPYEMRTFKVDPATLATLSLKFENNGIASADRRNINALATAFFSKLGVTIVPPGEVFYNDRLGVLFVYAIPQDLEVIGKAIHNLSPDPPQIHIKARFIEVPKKFFSSAAGKSLPRSMTNGMDILTTTESKKVLQLLESQKGTIELAEPGVVTLSHRQAILRATGFQPVLTNYSIPGHDPNLQPDVCSLETGPIFDVAPVALSDGYTINLSATATLTEFFGYADPEGLANALVKTPAGNVVGSMPLPAVQVSRASATVNIYDGQTLVLFPSPEQESFGYETDQKAQQRVAQYIRKARKKQGDKVLVVLCTATLIDAAGNRAHSDKEIPFAQTDVPPQPKGSVLPIVTGYDFERAVGDF
ncbi:MAG TPA: M56 family metallopeptidase [Alphaproteobacteria bacterium]|nr:M56 family metallopeptidase [Alphaproteobacteria bacterium]